MDVSTYFREGGFTMYVILILQFPAIFCGIATLAWAWIKRRTPRESGAPFILPAITIVVGLLVFGIGILGWQSGLEALQAIDESAPKAGHLRGRIEEVASYPLIYGTGIGIPTVIAGIMGLFMNFRRPH